MTTEETPKLDLETLRYVSAMIDKEMEGYPELASQLSKLHCTNEAEKMLAKYAVLKKLSADIRRLILDVRFPSRYSNREQQEAE